MESKTDFQKLKELLLLVIIVSLIALSYAAINYSRAYAKSIRPDNFRSFSASGQAKLNAVPDIAIFTFSIINQGGDDLQKIKSGNNDKLTKITTFLKESGVKEADIKTLSADVRPRYQHYACPVGGGACPPASIVGYTVEDTIQVKVRQLTMAGQLLSGVVSRGANQVSQLSWQIEDPTKLRTEAKKLAISKAKEQAEIIAKAGGFRLGQLLSVDEDGTPYAYGKGGGVATMAMELSADSRQIAPTPVSPGSQEIEINVTLRYQIK